MMNTLLYGNGQDMKFDVIDESFLAMNPFLITYDDILKGLNKAEIPNLIADKKYVASINNLERLKSRLEKLISDIKSKVKT